MNVANRSMDSMQRGLEPGGRAALESPLPGDQGSRLRPGSVGCYVGRNARGLSPSKDRLVQTIGRLHSVEGETPSSRGGITADVRTGRAILLRPVAIGYLGAFGAGCKERAVAPSKNRVADTVQPAASWPKPPDTFSRFLFR